MRSELRRLVLFVIFLPVFVYVHACRQSSSVETIDVALRNSEIYQYPTVAGDEDGARISTQAKNYSISEIRRNAETKWVAVYVYQPSAAFVGSDYAEIEVVTGSDGASAPTSIKKVGFRFTIKK